MRHYVMVTGAAFGLLTLAHAGRVYVEGLARGAEPDFVIATLVAMGLCGWAVYLLRQSSRRGS